MSKETFAANIHTCRSLVYLSRYLLENIGFQYVLLGKIQSDCIEERFGWMRQLSGANYFLSIRQLLENDKKIRAISLLRFSKLTLSDIDDAKDANVDHDTAADIFVDDIAVELYSKLTMDFVPEDSDNAVVYYVSGAVCRSIVNSFRCDSCCETLVLENDPLIFDISDIPDCSHLTAFLSRGGLFHPQKQIVCLGVFCWKTFMEVKSTPALKQKFLSFTNQRLLYCKLMEMVLENEIDMFFGKTHCTHGHNIVYSFCYRFFNCMCKNFISEINDDVINTKNKTEMRKRKISKLQSRTRQK